MSLIFENACIGLVGWFMVFNATFDNISAIYRDGQFYWRKSEYPEKTTSHRQTLSHNVVSSTPCHERGLSFSGDRH